MSDNTRTAAQDWNSFLDEYRSFGGTADNVIQRKGPLGLGLFPVDPSRPIKLEAPDHLLIPTNNLELHEGCIRLKNEHHYPQGFADWYQRFQSEYSWGAEARRSILEFESNLQDLPKDIRQILDQFLQNSIEKRFPGIDRDKEAFRRFVLTRQIGWKDKAVLMPLIELVNHSPNAESWIMDDCGISLQGDYNEEILVRYSVSDPLHRFIHYGFTCDERLAFSKNLRLDQNNFSITIRGGVNFTPFRPQPISIKENKIFIDRPLLGSQISPRRPRELMKENCKCVLKLDVDELFDKVVTMNRLSIINILRKLEKDKQNSELSQSLTESCLMQLNTLSAHQ